MILSDVLATILSTNKSFLIENDKGLAKFTCSDDPKCYVVYDIKAYKATVVTGQFIRLTNPLPPPLPCKVSALIFPMYANDTPPTIDQNSLENDEFARI